MACEVGAIILKDEETVSLWDSGPCLSAHGCSETGMTFLPPEFTSCPPGPAPSYKMGLSFKPPRNQHPKDDNRCTLSHLYFTRAVTFS